MSFLTRNAINTSNSPYSELNSNTRNQQQQSSHHPTSQRSSSSHNNVMYTRDWRSALKTPPTYRIGNRTVRFNYHFALLFTGVCALFVFFFYIRTGSSSSSDAAWLKKYASSTSVHSSSKELQTNPYNAVGQLYDKEIIPYNATYPLTPPQIHGSLISYRIAMVADLDTNSKVVKDDGSIVWQSFLKKGYLSYSEAKNEVSIKWDDGAPVTLESSFSLKGRGMELSELVTYNGKLLTFDDRTGLIYEIVNDKALPWIILLDGNGRNTNKGFKSEWATVKQQSLFVGSMGKEWTTSTGDFENENPMYVKMVAPNGLVRSLDWSNNFKLLRQETMQISWPGYMIHESGVWSEKHKKWFFLPRRCSKEKYNETRDELMGCNIVISVDENFTKFESVPLTSLNTANSHGFSSFKFIPNTGDRIIAAIKTEELNGKTTTFITVFDIDGKILLSEQKIDTDLKYEGFEFI